MPALSIQRGAILQAADELIAAGITTDPLPNVLEARFGRPQPDKVPHRTTQSRNSRPVFDLATSYWTTVSSTLNPT